jgi:hypothetical protein
MTKIVVKSDATAVFEVLKTATGVLLYPTVIAFHESRGLIYVNDQYAEAVISRLKKADPTRIHLGRAARSSIRSKPDIYPILSHTFPSGKISILKQHRRSK